MIRIPPAWRLALPLTLGVLLWLLLWYRETVLAIVDVWGRSATFTHGFVVPPIVAWLVWHRRAHLAVGRPRPDLRWLLAVAVFAFAWVLGDLTATNALAQIALVSMIVSTIPLMLGPFSARTLWFPLFFLYFAVPFGEFIVPILMEWTADFTVTALRVSGIPVYREGMHFVIPSGRWSVIEACSGIRYLIASLTVGTLFAYLNYHSIQRRAVFVVVSIVVPIVANWLRAYLIVLLGHVSDNTLAVGVDHLIYGWVFFGVVILVTFFIGARWAEPDPPVPAAAVDLDPSEQNDARFWWAASALAVLVVLPHGALHAARSGSDVPVSPLNVAALADAGWTETSATASWQPDYAGANREINVQLSRGQQTVGLYVGYFRDQGFDRKLLTSSNEIVSTSNKNWIKTGGRAIEIAWSGRPFSATQTRIRASGGIGDPGREELTVWSAFWVDGQWVRRPELAKLLLAKSMLMGRGDDSAVIMVYAFGDDRTATAALSQFAADEGDPLSALLQAVRR